MTNHDEAKTTPMVSIGMPVFNGMAYLSEALNSLLGQSFTDFEIILSDNSSTDHTERICREYAHQDSRIRYYRQTINIGAYPNFEFVLGLAKSPFFMWAAHDDKWDPRYIESCLEMLRSRPECGVAFTGYSLHSRSNRLLFRKWTCPAFDLINDLPKPWPAIGYLLLSERSHKSNVFYGVWRTSILAEAVRYCVALRERFGDDCHDIKVALFVFIRHRVAYVPRRLFHKYYPSVVPGGMVSEARWMLSLLRAPRRVSRARRARAARYAESLRVLLVDGGLDSAIALKVSRYKECRLRFFDTANWVLDTLLLVVCRSIGRARSNGDSRVD